jgi:ParB family chromosome partitioning protein
MEKKGLGKGLSALIPTTDSGDKAAALLVNVGSINANPFQPRHDFDEVKIDELGRSIQEKGLLQPLLVRHRGNSYELIAGERRLRAALKAGVKEVPVLVRDVTDQEALQLALIENLQREDLNSMEEAQAYRNLQEEFGLNQEDIAEHVAKSRPTIANAMRLLTLPQEIQQHVADGNLPAGQARALLSLESEALILAGARVVMARSLSTRETERLVRRLKLGRRRTRAASHLDPDLVSLIDELQRSLGTKVRLLHSQKSGKGKIEIDYYSTGDLERIIQKITASSQ